MHGYYLLRNASVLVIYNSFNCIRNESNLVLKHKWGSNKVEQTSGSPQFYYGSSFWVVLEYIFCLIRPSAPTWQAHLHANFEWKTKTVHSRRLPPRESTTHRPHSVIKHREEIGFDIIDLVCNVGEPESAQRLTQATRFSILTDRKII